VSDAVARILSSDKTVNRFNLGETKVCFESIIALMEGRSIVLSQENCESLQEIAKMIENEELLKKCLEFGIGKEEISVMNCIDRLKAKEESGCSIDEEIKFIASHFYELDTESLKEVKRETIESIISDECLCLRDEESLVKFIESLGEEYSFLYRYVECCFLSLEGIEEFLSQISENGMDERLWRSLCRRLRCELSNRRLTSPRFSGNQGKIFDYVEEHPFEGIIHAMSAECGGNVHKKSVVAITASGTTRGQAFRVANHGWDGYWESTDAPNSWICFDFREQGAALSHYTLKSHGSTGHWFLMWAIEGSNDGSNWTVLDERNTQHLNDMNIVKTYECSKNCSEFFRFIRMRQTGRNSSNTDFLILTNIEFFGRMN
jgi:hypothetical protein